MSKKNKTAISPTRAEDFPLWYQNVVKAADMAENAPVRGCMTIKPYGFAIWENIRNILDGMIKDNGVENACFPLLIPMDFLTKEAEHVDGFATECAVVTHHRLEKNENGEMVPAGKLENPYVIRPTSETIIGEAMSRWIGSYRDLPMKLNQWANVMRWEMRPRIFLRTAEFFWQEGHNAFANEVEAKEDTRKMLAVYKDLIENYFAMPVIDGEKTDDDKFPGAVSTLTVESMMQDGKSLQMGTSHYMGTTFAKSSNITYQTKEGTEEYAHTTSWGVSTRMIGGIIMAHSDDDGLIVPPKIAPHHVVLLPFIRNDEDHDKIMEHASNIADKLKSQGIRVKLDNRDMKAPDKMWDAIKKGVPVRVEIGAREVDADNLTHVRRDIGRSSKETCTVDEFISKIPNILDDIHNNLFQTAKERQESRIYYMSDIQDIEKFFAEENEGFVKMPVEFLDNEQFMDIRKKYAVTPRCINFSDNGKMVIVGKSY